MGCGKSKKCCGQQQQCCPQQQSPCGGFGGFPQPIGFPQQNFGSSNFNFPPPPPPQPMCGGYQQQPQPRFC